MTSRLTRILAILAVTSLVSSCKLEVVAVQGGDIEWEGGSCSEGSNCVIEITDPTFSKTFTVKPKPGYEFVKWQKAPSFFCGDSISTACTITMPADTRSATAITSFFVTATIMPFYNDIGIDFDGDGQRAEVDVDDDADNVFDVDDACPATPLGTYVDITGCSPSTACPCVDNYPGGFQSLEQDMRDTFNNINSQHPISLRSGYCEPGRYDMLITIPGPTFFSIAYFASADPASYPESASCDLYVMHKPRISESALTEEQVQACWNQISRVEDIDPLQACP